MHAIHSDLEKMRTHQILHTIRDHHLVRRRIKGPVQAIDLPKVLCTYCAERRQWNEVAGIILTDSFCIREDIANRCGQISGIETDLEC